ncbi:hypothetical protein M3661_24355 [Paenibacillus sp. MER 180]|uniref:hypothetical protein n=1 Tax=unclassified Paenibacillus TaxID=185978 RepID=UPI000806671C|nr:MULTISPECIES: hypothetical protein [unclassified Paenibacillus]MCM3293247.1 hypothetical protein [Paenibacillus sp. MER 180]OBY79434.1 hypothetical protein BBG47_11180 [Paenibacillus sp. KS1]
MEKFEFVVQIASEEKPRFMIGDNGNMYIYRSKTDEGVVYELRLLLNTYQYGLRFGCSPISNLACME